MYNNNKTTVFLFTTLAGCSGLAAAEGFVEDGKATLSMRNFYMNRDFRDGAGRSKSEEWAQGFLLDYRSGYTPGTVGFGVDVLGKLGIKLDSSSDRAGTGLLPVQEDGQAADNYSRLGATAKLRVARSELKVGTLVPKLPTVQPNYGRLFPQMFQGGMLTSNDLANTTLTLGRLDEVSQRNESGQGSVALYNRNSRFRTAAPADHFYLGGVDYQWNKQWSSSYHYGKLDDVYAQHFIGVKGRTAVGSDALELDLRLSISDDTGSAAGGKIDNRALNGMLTYRQHAGHAFGLGLQKMSGDSAFPYLDGTDPYLINFAQYGDFSEQNEKSWQLRYDYDFAASGIPGLSFMTRYFHGEDAKVLGHESGREWERDTDIKYVIQGGPLAGVGITWRNATYRSSFTRDVDENRFYLSYEMRLF